jgi:hypothetical protein
MAMTLMEILVECENTLGWIPKVLKGQNVFQARARTHRVLSRSMAQRGISVEDMALALAYCQRRRQPISAPAELLPLVKEARRLAAPTRRLSSLDVRQGEALAWEHQRLDDDSPYWIGRIVRSLNTGLEDVLTEWAGAGRG